MTQLYRQPADFEATINILSTEAGGRINPPFNGIRWDFAYAADGDTDSLFMIWPDFFDEAGDSLPTDQPLAIGVDLPARMTVVVDEMREQVHRQRIAVGTTFYCHEGRKRVAFGTVTRITGLLTERTSPIRSIT